MTLPPGGSRVMSWLGGRTGRRADRSFRARVVVQSLFALTCVFLGIQFTRFVKAASQGATPLPTRPPGAEAFLPISGLMGLVDWVYQGTLNAIHPAASILVALAFVLAFLLRKSFCSWVCPIGFLSELLARFGRWSFGRNFLVWRWLDGPLRGIKYLLMAFFVVSVLTMSEAALAEFMSSPYNRVADIKMGLFFAELGRVGIVVLGGLVLGSIFIQGFWCRYLCPYGALLGLFSWRSPARVTRVASACVDCGLCDKACMARLPVSRLDAVARIECTGCLDCVAACPIPVALEMRVGRRCATPVAYAAAVLAIFLSGYAGARLTGHWENEITDLEYVDRIQDIHSPEYGHPGMSGPVEPARTTP